MVACSSSNRATGDPGIGCFSLFETLLTWVKLELPFPPFYCGVLSILCAMAIQIHPNGWAFIRCFYLLCQLLGFEAMPRCFFTSFILQIVMHRGIICSPSPAFGAKNLLVAFELSYKKKTYQNRFFKLKPKGLVATHFFDSSSITRFPLKWSPFTLPSPRLTINDFSIEERGHVDVFDKLSSDINTQNLECIRCTEII